MISFGYLAVTGPPAPFASVSIRHPDGSGTVEWVPARVDSAADRTVIPVRIAEALRLESVEELEFEGIGGRVETMPIYSIRLAIRGLDPIPVSVAAHGGEQYVLLGRDLLNRYKITLDGPNQKLEIV
jgi:predicted aspartyl protease